MFDTNLSRGSDYRRLENLDLFRMFRKPFNDNSIYLKPHLLSVLPTFDHISLLVYNLIKIHWLSRRRRSLSDCFLFTHLSRLYSEVIIKFKALILTFL